jgi:hypothetical protein
VALPPLPVPVALPPLPLAVPPALELSFVEVPFPFAVEDEFPVPAFELSLVELPPAAFPPWPPWPP